MAMEDIRSRVPKIITDRLLSDEHVYFYGTGQGCLGGSKSFIVITDSRVFGAEEEAGGCLGLGKNVSTVDITLQQVSSVRTSTSGCLFSKVATVVVSSGTANNAFSAGNTADSQRAATILQQAMRDVRNR